MNAASKPRLTRRQPLGPGQPVEVAGDGGQQPVVDVDGVPAGPQVGDQLLGVGQRAPVAEGAAPDLQHVHPQLGRDQAGQRGKPERGVRVQLKRLAAEGRLHGGDQRPRPVRGEDARRVLDVGAVDVRAVAAYAAAMPA